MRHSRAAAAALVSMGFCLTASAAVVVPAASAAAEPSGRALVQRPSTAASAATELSATPADATINFNVGLTLKNPSGAVALEQAVSDPSSPSYRQFLTPAQWESHFSPTQASVAAVTSWLKSQGIEVEAVTPDRMTVQASGTAAAVSRAFGTSLGQYRRQGHVVRLASSALTVPASVASLISGVSGVDQQIATHHSITGGEVRRAARRSAKKSPAPIPQPEGFRNAPPCSTYAGQVKDKTDPPLPGYPALRYAPCGYTPPQLQGAYGLTSQIAGGIDGKGVTVAVVDAYASPSILGDAQHYSELNQPLQPLASAQFSQVVSPKFNNIELCEASGWFGEETLDVEAVHATAPGADIVYMGAKNCLTGLNDSIQQVIDGHLAQVITNSWGDNAGDLLDSDGSRRSFDNILLMAAGTGITVMFSSGDEGDEFALTGITTPDYPPSSPYATAVGGTSLLVDKTNGRQLELGWSTSKSFLCTPLLQEFEQPGCEASTLNTWLPGAFLYGGGGGTSYKYPEPSYQAGVVPAALANRNSSITGGPGRVEPDISMVGDPTTGMLVGETQLFPEGEHYDQYRIGGTSLSSPLFAGVVADADQVAGGSLGFVNPAIYSIEGSATASSAFYDVRHHGARAYVRNDYADGFDAEEGILTSARSLDYQGIEEFCSGTGNCTQQNVALETAHGFDSMTGVGTPGDGLLGALAKPPGP